MANKNIVKALKMPKHAVKRMVKVAKEKKKKITGGESQKVVKVVLIYDITYITIFLKRRKEKKKNYSRGVRDCYPGLLMRDLVLRKHINFI